MGPAPPHGTRIANATPRVRERGLGIAVATWRTVMNHSPLVVPKRESGRVLRYILMWLLGVPVSVILLIALFSR